jgi:hypothetical protein
MASYPLVHEGTGATITYGSSGFTAEVVSIKRSPRKFEKLDTTYLGTTGQKTYLRSLLADPGELDLEVHYNPDIRYPETTTSETFTITFPVIGTNGTPSTDASSGFVVETQEVDIAIGKVMMSKIKVQLTGAVTHVNTAT